jgi:DNA primase
VYTETPAFPTADSRPSTRRYRGVSYTTPIKAAKEAVPVIDLADRLCDPDSFKRLGNEWIARCPLPDHEDRTPSFTVNAAKNVWFCHGCLRGGDVVDLARLAWGYAEGDARVAAADVLHEFGHEIPQRPASWHRKQERQRHTREAVEKTVKNITRRRLFKHLILPHVNAIEDEEERNEELERAWSDFRRFMP